jgi:hypothetical protein
MPFDTTTLDSPFTALAAFDWGGDAAPLGVIDAAVVAAHGDAALTANLEKRLSSIISGSVSLASRTCSSHRLSCKTLVENSFIFILSFLSYYRTKLFRRRQPLLYGGRV